MSLADELLTDLEEDDNDAELLLMEKEQKDEERRAQEEAMEPVSCLRFRKRFDF